MFGKLKFKKDSSFECCFGRNMTGFKLFQKEIYYQVRVVMSNVIIDVSMSKYYVEL